MELHWIEDPGLTKIAYRKTDPKGAGTQCQVYIVSHKKRSSLRDSLGGVELTDSACQHRGDAGFGAAHNCLDP